MHPEPPIEHGFDEDPRANACNGGLRVTWRRRTAGAGVGNAFSLPLRPPLLPTTLGPVSPLPSACPPRQAQYSAAAPLRSGRASFRESAAPLPPWPLVSHGLPAAAVQLPGAWSSRRVGFPAAPLSALCAAPPAAHAAGADPDGAFRAAPRAVLASGAADEPVGPQRRAALQRDARHSGLDGLVREPGSSSTATSEDEGGEAQEERRPGFLAHMERAARTAFLTPETVGGFVSKVRTGLMMCRQEGVNDLFQRYDLFNSGVLDLNTVFDILADRKLMPKEWELQRFLCETFVDEGAEPGKQVSFRGWEHFKRRHAAVPISCQEFLHLFHFLQQSDEQSASETEWAEAKRYGIADVRLYMALREEVAALHRALRRYGTAGASPPRSPRATEDAGASYDKNEVWVALNTLGPRPHELPTEAKILKVVKKGCTHGELKTGSTSGLTALGSRLIEGWGSSKSAARMSFEDFLRVVVRVRELVRREESFHLRPVFARHCTPAAVGRLASGAPGALDTRTIDTAGIFR
ncbi:unnamed protein product, partial [Prorocentrum cordatum]